MLGALGGGGQGQVVRAYDPELRVERAVKVLAADQAQDAEARMRLKREAQLASRLRHPGICGIHDVGEDGGRLYVVMDLLEGETLRDRLAAGPLEVETARRIAGEIAGALAYAHGQGVVHRDLSSANVILAADGRVVLLDFGLARQVAGAAMGSLPTATMTGVVVGTPDYIAPEVLHGERADARADVWALGVLLHEMLSGGRPFQRPTTTQTLAAVLQSPPAPLPPTVPMWMAGIVDRCLEKDPARRFPAAADVQAALVYGAGAAAAAAPRHWTSRAFGSTRRRVVIAVTALALAVAAVPCIRGGPAMIRALAVLPLKNHSGDPGQEYFAEGMTDELTTTLGQIGALQVIAHNSVADYDPSKVPLRRIAHTLGVGALVTGDVMRSGDQVRIDAQLVEGRSGRLMWSNSYVHDVTDVFRLQNEVSRAIAEQIRVRLTPAETARLNHARAVDPKAYEDYLRAREAWGNYTQQGFAEAERLFRGAIARDSTWAQAWAGLADALYGPSNVFVAPNVAIPRARQAAQHALALDPGSAEAHTSLGITSMVYDWDWEGAEREFRRALELRPQDADAHWWLGHLLCCRGQFDAAIPELRHAQALDPNNLWYRGSLPWHLYLARRFDEAADSLRRMAASHPGYFIPHVFLGLVLQQQHQLPGAVTELERAVAMDVKNDDLGQLGQAYGAAGRRGDAERMLARLRQRAATGFVPAASFAMVYTGLGERDSALTWLERATEDHSEFLIFAAVDPALASLRGDPRFLAILHKLHLGPA